MKWESWNGRSEMGKLKWKEWNRKVEMEGMKGESWNGRGLKIEWWSNDMAARNTTDRPTLSILPVFLSLNLPVLFSTRRLFRASSHAPLNQLNKQHRETTTIYRLLSGSSLDPLTPECCLALHSPLLLTGRRVNTSVKKEENERQICF